MTDVFVKFCSSCGTPNRGTRFCASCGASAVIESPAPVQVAPVREAEVPVLEVFVPEVPVPEVPMPQGLPLQPAQHPGSGPSTPWSEPSRAVQLSWGTYRVRLLTAYGLVALACLLPPLIVLSGNSALLAIFGIVAAVATLAAFVVLPGRLGLRLGAAAIALLGLAGAVFESVLVVGPAAIALSAAWFMARQRPGISYLFLILAGLLGTAALFSARLLFLQVAVVIVAWLGRLVAPAGDRAKARRAVAPIAAPGSAHTNTMAIMALVFGLVGGTGIPIVLGHVALSQIRRTGEGGRGLAIAGLVLGYVGIGGLIVVGIFALFLTGRG